MPDARLDRWEAHLPEHHPASHKSRETEPPTNHAPAKQPKQTNKQPEWVGFSMWEKGFVHRTRLQHSHAWNWLVVAVGGSCRMRCTAAMDWNCPLTVFLDSWPTVLWVLVRLLLAHLSFFGFVRDGALKLAPVTPPKPVQRLHGTAAGCTAIVVVAVTSQSISIALSWVLSLALRWGPVTALANVLCGAADFCSSP